MKKLIAYAILALVSTVGYGQNQCDIKSHYEDFVLVQKAYYNDEPYLINRILEPLNTSCIADLVKNDLMFMEYLLTNFSSTENHQNLLELTDSLAIRNTYFDELRNDAAYNSIMEELVNKTVNKSMPKDTISMDNLLNVAVKYFSIERVTDDGKFAFKVCSGLNDIKKTESERNPFLEAFSFSSILKHYQGEEYSMFNEAVKSVRELYKVNLGLDKEEKLLRAQGAMFLLMRNNENLRKMLKIEYAKQKDYLPFLLKDVI